MWWVILIVVVSFVFWMHYSRAMSDSDRISVALDIVDSSNFCIADGFDEATVEDPDLVGWIKDKNDCVMLFRSRESGGLTEIVDFASDSFHPGLVIQFLNAEAVRVDSADVEDSQVRSTAEKLLRRVKHIMEVKLHPEPEYDGCHY